METETTDTTVKLRSIYMYRMVNGVKTRWKFEVDKEMIIVNEGPVNTPIPGKAVEPESEISAAQAKVLASYKRVLDGRGVSYDITNSGQLIIKNVPDNEKLIQQFLDFNSVMEDPALAALKEAYKSEYASLGGVACTGCQLGGLQRKYREKVQSAINDKKIREISQPA